MATKRDKQRRRGKRDTGPDRHAKAREQHQGGGEWECLTPPSGLEVFKPEAKNTYHMDLIPTVVGEYNKAAREGYEWYEFSYPCYNNLGIEDKRYVALQELTGEADPVAAHFAKVRNAAGVEWDDIKHFKPKKRQMFLVFVHEEADKGLQFYETSYHTFGELLQEEIDAETEDYVTNLDDPEGGATVVVRFKAQDIGQKNPWVRASKITFEERPDGFDADGDEELAEQVLDAAAEITLDTLLKVPTYETLLAALNGEPAPEDEDEDAEDEPAPKPKRARRKPEPAPEDEDEDAEDEPAPKPKRARRKPKPEPEPEPEDEDEDEDEDDIPMWHKGDAVYHEEHGTSQIVRVAKDGTTCTVRDEDGELQKLVPCAELEAAEPEPEPEPEPAPKKAPKKTPAKKAPKKTPAKKAKPEPEPEPEDEDEDGDWDEDWT